MITTRNLNRLYYILGIVITALGVYLVMTDVLPFLAAVLILDVLFWCIGSVIAAVMQKREKKLLGLMQECRIREFIEKYSREHAGEHRQAGKAGEGFSSGAAIQLATAYMNLGDLETSMKIFRTTEPQNPNQVKKKVYINAVTECAVYYNNLSAVDLRRHEIEQAKLHMDEAKKYCKLLQEEEKKRGKKYPAIDILQRAFAVRDLEFSLEVEEETGIAGVEHEEDIKKLRGWIDSAESGILTKVYYHCLLYRIYRKKGDMDAAEECREYVGQNGGDSCYIQWVQEEQGA